MNFYRDMYSIRAFEQMISQIKTTERFGDISYHYSGPVHLCAGEEAVCVGAAFYQTTEDFTFGSHRSHGETLAKGLRATQTLSEEKLLSIMETYAGGRIFQSVQDRSLDVRANARRFLFYGLLSEIFGRTTGFNRGLCGSMHAFFLPFGIYPCNAIVGGSGTIAVGAGLYKRINRENGVAICNLGDGATATGSTYEALTMATMEQIRTLWGARSGAVPVLFQVTNNFYAMGGQTAGETMSLYRTATIPVGLADTQLHAERVDGMNLLAVLDAYRRLLPVARSDGPVWLDCVTYRYYGHNLADNNNYRTREEIEKWRAVDPIETFAQALCDARICDLTELEAVRKLVDADILFAVARSVDERYSPKMDLRALEKDGISKYVFSNGRVETDGAQSGDMLCPLRESRRAQSIARRRRFGLDAQGREIPTNRRYQIRDAIAEPILRRMYEDPKLIIFGEDVRDWGGAYAVYRDFEQAIPYHRLFDTPICECGIIGAAVGYAMCGGRVVTEIMYDDFSARAADELFNQLAKWQAMSAGEIRLPVVVRMSVGSDYGAQHTQDWTALFAHIPGLKVVYPVTPYDAKGLMEAALRGTDPVIFLESQALYDVGEYFHQGGVPEEAYEIALGEPDVKREGDDLTILTVGAALYRGLQAADILKNEYGLSVEVIDARSIVPFDYEKVVASVRKTGRIVLMGDGCERNSIMRHFASKITELAFDALDAPPCVLGAKNWLAPSHELTREYFPQPSWVVDIVHQCMLPLKGHRPQRDFSAGAQMRESRLGI
ncbi:MAG TPA: dehydrogenase [Candidatus Pullichristensenella avicola]|nr:dehydrogenase [Candidatus Pullichristensenella avicola]